MEYFLVRYDSRVVNYDCRGFIRLGTGVLECPDTFTKYVIGYTCCLFR